MPTAPLASGYEVEKQYVRRCTGCYWLLLATYYKKSDELREELSHFEGEIEGKVKSDIMDHRRLEKYYSAGLQNSKR